MRHTNELRDILTEGRHMEKHISSPHFGVKFVEFTRSYIAMLCCYEHFVFSVFIATHEASENLTLRAWLPSYTIKQWADGKFSDPLMSLADDALINLRDLMAWAKSMILFNHAFAELDIVNPAQWLKSQGFIVQTPTGMSWLRKDAAPRPID